MTNEKYSITTAIIERTGTYYVVQATLIMDGCTFQAMGSRDGSPMGAEDSAVERVKTLAGIASSFIGTADSKNEKKSSSDDDEDLDF